MTDILYVDIYTVFIKDDNKRHLIPVLIIGLSGKLNPATLLRRAYGSGCYEALPRSPSGRKHPIPRLLEEQPPDNPYYRVTQVTVTPPSWGGLIHDWLALGMYRLHLLASSKPLSSPGGPLGSLL